MKTICGDLVENELGKGNFSTLLLCIRTTQREQTHTSSLLPLPILMRTNTKALTGFLVDDVAQEEEDDAEGEESRPPGEEEHQDH